MRRSFQHSRDKAKVIVPAVFEGEATGVATGEAAQVTLSQDKARHAASLLVKTADTPRRIGIRV
jgi:hypothetical protein